MSHPVFDIAPRELGRLRALTADQALLAASAPRDGVLSTRQLQALGLQPPAISRKLGQCRLHHLHRGVYAVGRPDLRRNGWRRAALLRFGRRAVLAETTAASLLDLLRARDRVDLAVPGRPARPAQGSGIQLRHSSVWLPVTALRAQIARERTGVELLRARLERYTATAPLESVLEERFFALCAEHGLPRPVCQWPLEEGQRHGRVDFVFVDEGVAVEVDGREWHATQTAFEQDRARDLALREHGYDPHRYTWWQLRDEGARVAAAVGAALTGRRNQGTFR